MHVFVIYKTRLVLVGYTIEVGYMGFGDKGMQNFSGEPCLKPATWKTGKQMLQ